jgi:sensor histidine kinase YesM
MKRPFRTFAIIFFIGTVIFVIGNLLGNRFQFESFNALLINFSIYQLYSFVLGYANMYYFKYLETIPWKENSGPKRIFAGVAGSTVVSVAGLFVLRMFRATLWNGQSITDFLAAESFQNYYFGLSVALIVVLIFHVVYFYNRDQKKKVKESQIVAKTESAKFESLKNQLDPHFLFNSLNVLTSLIGESPYQAEKFTTKLSKVYRYVLEQKDKDLISLNEELAFARSYMQLLQMRFEDAVAYNIPQKVSQDEAKIVPLSLQLLLENAVKHNVITSEQPLRIEIFEDDGYLVVENNINPKASLEKSTKVGLSNIKQRYQLVTDRQVVIEDENNVFRVKLPLLTREIKVIKTDYMNDNAKYMRAKKRVEELKEFYGSLIAYVFVMPFLVYINYRTSWGFQWFWFPLFGWGLGLTIHALKTFGYGANWEERKIREIMEKEENEKYY